MIAAAVLLAPGPLALGANVSATWNVANGNWNVASNWLPNGVPNNGANLYFVNIGAAAIANGAQVTFVPLSGSSGTISTLTVQNNADLYSNGFQLNVLGQTTLDGAGTTIRVDPHNTPATAAFTTANLDLNNGGGLIMAGGIANVTTQLEINASSVLGGYGTINVGDGGGVSQAFENSALLQPQGNTAAPQTLTIHAVGSDTIDLDGDSETGVVDVDNALANVNSDTVTLVIDGALSDQFGGIAGAALQIGQRDTLTFTKDFAIFGPAAITMNGGNSVATLNGAGNITDIQGASFTITGAAVIANDMTFSGVANTITLAANSTLTLNGTVTIPDASAINTSSTGETIVIGGTTTITEAAGDFDWDSFITTVNGSGFLQLAVDQIDAGNDTYNGALTLSDNGDLSVSVTATEWQMAGTLNKNGVGNSNITGDRMVVTSTGNIVVDAGTLDTPAITLQAGSDVTVNGTFILGGGAELAGPATLTGTGTLRMEASSTVTANTTVNVSTFDWDGNAVGGTHTINPGVVFTINSPTFDSDGDMDDPVSLGGNGAQLIVNGSSSWTMSGVFSANSSVAGTATIGGTSRMIVANTLNVDGITNVTGLIDFASGSTTSIDLNMALSLQGGSLGTPNTVTGGTISGLGEIQATAGHALSGFGSINNQIDFDGSAELMATGGLLNVNGIIEDVGTMRVSNAATMNLANAMTTAVTDGGIVLSGGTLQGLAVTTGSVSKPITGSGTVSNVVTNTGAIIAQNGTLVFTNISSDWDGAGAGQLNASIGGVLELQDNSTFGFTGSVNATLGGRVYSNGFGIDFNPGSSINLNAGTYESTSSTDIGGNVVVSTGADSTIKVANNFFMTFETGSSTAINGSGNLRLLNNNINIESGATFSGPGAMIIPKGSHLVADNGANIGVLLNMAGAFRPGNFEGIGKVDLHDYQQNPASGAGSNYDDGGELFVELRGTLLNQYDRLVASGTAQIGGYLNVDIDEVSPGVPFVPSLGNVFNIISATGGVIGTFNSVDIAGMPMGLTFHVNYQPTFVQLQVVNKPFFSADFDDDGDVDMTDYAIWKGAYMLNQLGDADGDNDSDAADFTIWRDQLGAMPGPLPGTIPGAVPEPGSGAVIALAGAMCGLRRRRPRRRAAATITSAVICALGLAFPSMSQARPTLSVIDNNINAGLHREFLVKIAPDTTTPPGGQESMATEFGFSLSVGSLFAVTVNTTDWAFANPGQNPFGGANGPGLVGTFASFGSNKFSAGTQVQFLKIETNPGPVTLNWGNYNVGGHAGARIAQKGVIYYDYTGSISVGASPGDFDSDGDLDNADIDALLHATQGSVPPALAKFDLNGNNNVNSVPLTASSDSDVWVQTLKNTRYGDANLDGRVNLVDFGILASHFNQSAQGWAAGNFNTDGVVNGLDFNAIATNFGYIAPAPPVLGSVVPEPSTLAALVPSLTLLSGRRRSMTTDRPMDHH